ncbi:response regulator transcription factor [Sphingomonas xinjiangensis]|uniref:DNA-binding response OmpR family regulator n=1 Tax=Sphingomonas xinjiangensis TaxID=643568 RepID=A0A840YTB2_9SPHN|nr:response regulator [Sphingomonas xinjiangensis]MBB5712961.1 DNA-binding response OmpR family regulator [Sphingomonas xinjiangensis]
MIKILCIDDEVEIRNLLVEELQDAGFGTIEASNGEEGIQQLLAHWPDIVICDVSMPVMDGHGFLAELQLNHPEFANTPVIMLTAMTDRENTLSGLASGADDYLTKPVDLDILMAKISGCVMRLQSSHRSRRS